MAREKKDLSKLVEGKVTKTLSTNDLIESFNKKQSSEKAPASKENKLVRFNIFLSEADKQFFTQYFEDKGQKLSAGIRTILLAEKKRIINERR